MPFTTPGRDIEMARNPATGRLDFAWDATGNPTYADTNSHRVLSLLVEHRPVAAAPSSGIPGGPGYWADATGKRGSAIYSIKNLRKSTPSELESAATDALQKAVDESWISDVRARAFVGRNEKPRLEIAWRNPGARQALLTVVALAT